MEGKIPSQNLIRQVNAESASRQPGFYKTIVFDALTVLSAIALGYTYKQYLLSRGGITVLLVTILVYAAFATLQVFFSKTIGHRFSILLLEIMALSGFFYDIDFKMLAISAAIVLVFFLWGDLGGKRELNNGLQIRFFKAATPFLKKFTTAVILMLIIFYLPRLDQDQPFISKENFQVIFGWASGLTTKFYPEINFNSSFGKLAEGIARLELQTNQNFKSLPSANQEELIRQAADQVSQAIGKSLGVTISLDEPASDVFYNFVLAQVSGLRARFGDLFTVGFVLAVFIAVRGVGIIFYWIAGFFTFIVYQILLASGFIHILGESRTHEVIVY
ncbi:MAG: hypothetical protein Q7R94_02060 [bacterium]|nr:hypothetical protein [bacterium]